MHFNQLNIKKSIFLFFLLTVQFNSFGQDFEWVYNIIGTPSEDYGISPNSQINDVVVDNQDNIYITGRSSGEQDFSDGAGTIMINSSFRSLYFIVKLNKNKNVLWVKHFNVVPGVQYDISQIHIDANYNVLLTGDIKHQGGSFIDLNPDPGEQQTIQNPSIFRQGVIIKLDSSGNYITSRHYDAFTIVDLAFDSNQNIIATGGKSTEVFGDPVYYYKTARVFKLDSDLNSLWTKEFDAPSASIGTIIADNQDNLIIRGSYEESLNFGGENFVNETGNFICKLNSDGSDDWILEQQEPYIGAGMILDSYNTIHTLTRYNASSSFVFNNTTLSNLPYSGMFDSALVSMDTDGNYLSHLTFSGPMDQSLSFEFAINELDEFIFGLRNTDEVSIRNSNNDEIVSFTTGQNSNVLLKISAQQEFIDYKLIEHVIGRLSTDSENNIIIGGTVYADIDFDPHPINEHLFQNETESSGYVLKLSYCDTFPPTGDPNFTFCSDESYTVADLQTNEHNVSWYATESSTTPLDGTTPLADGQTYFAAKNKVENCPEIMERLAVLVIINPIPPAPTLTPNQPCFSNNLRLADLNIEGANLAFYNGPTSSTKLNIATIIDPNSTYFVSQTVADCESERVAFTIPAQSNVAVNDYTVILCDSDRNNFEQVNLSNYIAFLLNGNPDDFTISYHNSLVDAENGSNPIQDFEAFEANSQTIYVRFLNNAYSCYEIATLTISVSFPPEITEIIARDGTSSSNSITILPLNPQYLYSIDGIHYQSSNVFDNVLAGEYLVYVKDSLEACSEVTEKVYLLTYPKFFTPNGDGYNDFWKIKYAQFQFAVDVEIYDRYGKLITSFDKNSPGWDGKYNGENLPSTDYWFKVTRFLDKKVIHKGHFSLKR